MLGRKRESEAVEASLTREHDDIRSAKGTDLNVDKNANNAGPGNAILPGHHDVQPSEGGRDSLKESIESASDYGDPEVLEKKYTREAVERLRTHKRAAAIGIHRLGLGPRATDFSVDDLSEAAHTAGEADPDQVSLLERRRAVKMREAGNVPLEPFNMRKEMEEGSFDADGNFEWRKKTKDEDVSDPWLASVDVGDVSATFASDADRARAALLGSTAEAVSVDPKASLLSLAQLIGEDETPTDALRRLAALPSRPRSSARKRRVIRGLTPALRGVEDLQLGATHGEEPKQYIDVSTETSSLTPARDDNDAQKKAFEEITELCTALMATGRNVYFCSRGDLIRIANELRTNAVEGRSGGEMHDETRGIFWQFRWVNNPKDKDIHGPYESSTFLSWINEGFISDDNPVEVRRVSALNEPLDGLWASWTSVDFQQQQQKEDAEGADEQTQTALDELF